VSRRDNPISGEVQVYEKDLYYFEFSIIVLLISRDMLSQSIKTINTIAVFVLDFKTVTPHQQHYLELLRLEAHSIAIHSHL
jgi:hypothetical protein